MKKTKSAPASNAETQNDLCVLTGEAEKINPHSTGLLHWEMTENLDGKRGLRIIANDSGGLFSREWIALSAISGVLKAHGIHFEFEAFSVAIYIIELERFIRSRRTAAVSLFTESRLSCVSTIQST